MVKRVRKPNHQSRESLGPRTRRVRLVGTLFQYYPFLLGAYRIVNDPRIRWIFENEGECLVRLPCGLKIWVDLNDNDGRAIFCGGNDPKLRRIFALILRPGDRVVDVGANQGEYTLLAAELVGAIGSVYAFEPNLALVTKLQRSIRANGLRNIQVIGNALSDRAGIGYLTTFSGWSGGSYVTPAATVGGEAAVGIATLDDVAGEFGGKPIRLLKIDVEGNEGAVLRGGRKLFLENPPDVVVFESNPSSVPFCDREPAKILGGNGAYALFEICRNLFKLRLKSIGTEEVAFPHGRDFLAIRRSLFPDIAEYLPIRYLN